MSGDYAIGLLTIITGLAIADVVTSLHLLLVNRAQVRWDWLPLLATFFIVVLIVAIWGISYSSIGGRNYNPALWEFAARLGQIIPMYLAARAVLPDEVGPDGVSLADHYVKVCRYFWSSVALTYAIYLGFLLSQSGPSILLGADASPAFQLLLMAVLIIFCRRRVHAILVPIIAAMLCYDHLTRPMFG